MTDLLRYGVVGRAHGLHGTVRIHPHSGDLGTADLLTQFWIGSEAGLAVPYAIQSLRPFKNAFLATLEGVDSEERAVRLAGQTVWVDRSLFDDEPGWYIDELHGSEVVQEPDGRHIGRVVGFADSGGPMLVEISRGNRSIYIPWVDPFVRGVEEREGATVVVLTTEAPVDL